MEKEVFFNRLFDKANKIGISLTEEQMDQFYKYMNLLLMWNEKMNLTAITDPEEIILKHFIDSMAIGFHIKQGYRLLDVGTGAGFPGVPLKIIHPNVQITLMDALNKRIKFLDEVCTNLRFQDFQCIHSRAEELAVLEQHREQYDVVTSRAVARLNILLEYMLPFAKLGGNCICMKGSEINEELEEAKNAIYLLGGELEKVEKITLPDSDLSRNNIIIKKVKNTPVKYPRKAGMPTKQPIF